MQADPYLSKILAINLEDTEREIDEIEIAERKRESWKVSGRQERAWSLYRAKKEVKKINVC